MKTTSKISAVVLAGIMAASLQAKALTFTETLSGINAEVEGTTYTGTFHQSSLLSGTTVFNNTLYTISSAVIDLTMVNAAGHTTTLTVDAIGLNLTPTTSPQTLAYTLTSTQDAYIAAMNGTFNFGVSADCVLQSAELIVNTTTKPQNGNSVPEAGPSALLLASSLVGLGLLKRKLA